MKRLALVMCLAAGLAGCADTPLKDAVIEDRGVKALPPVAGTDATATQGVVVAPVESEPIKDAVGRSDAPAEAPAPAKTVETHALPEPATEIKPMAGDPGAANADTAAMTPEQAQAAIALKLKDPNSPLSKRVILFDYDSSAIRDEYRTILEAHAEFLKSNPASKAILQGHADERGSREYNLALGQRRAESVFNAMSVLGVTQVQLEPVSMGEEKPAAEGHDEESWQQNRRTEILYQGE